jgi:hypothetical protein
MALIVKVAKPFMADGLSKGALAISPLLSKESKHHSDF